MVLSGSHRGLDQQTGCAFPEVLLPSRSRRERALYPVGGLVLRRRARFSLRGRGMRSPPLPQARGSCSLKRLGCTPPDSASAERSCREDSGRTNGCLRSVCGPACQSRNPDEESRPVIAACGGPERNGRTQSLYSQNARPGEEAATKDPAAHDCAHTFTSNGLLAPSGPRARAAGAIVDVSSTALGSSTSAARRLRAISIRRRHVRSHILVRGGGKDHPRQAVRRRAFNAIQNPSQGIVHDRQR